MTRDGVMANILGSYPKATGSSPVCATSGRVKWIYKSFQPHKLRDIGFDSHFRVLKRLINFFLLNPKTEEQKMIDTH